MGRSTNSASPSQSSAHRRTPSHLRSNGGDIDVSSSQELEKFPDHVDSHLSPDHEQERIARSLSPLHGNGYANGRDSSRDRWAPRRDSRTVRWGPSGHNTVSPASHSRQKSLSDAFRTIRSRRGSVSQNAHEIADALRAPVSPKLVTLCVLWYASSALTNTSSKTILIAWDKPATLTVVQFAFVASYCLLFAWLASVFPRLKASVPALKHGIQYPTTEVIATTWPLAAFQIFGHLLSSTATSKIPVSLVHTIKGLSPLFTVMAYRFVYNIRYSVNTYLSLVPLTLGVMLACSGKHNQFGGEFLGLLYALLATIVFVTQNIFSKRLFNEAAKAEASGISARTQKLDKLNLLCYSSGLAFVFTIPIWFWSEGVGIMKEIVRDGAVDLSTEKGRALDHGRLSLEFFFNGTFHFGQNILAFVLLSLVSPVTYSVASLIKRVFVIVIALIWFQSPTTSTQGVGICLTFLGLYLYDRTHDRDKADRKARMMEIKEEPLLPLDSRNTQAPTRNISGFDNISPAPGIHLGSGFAPQSDDLKKTDELHNGARGQGGNGNGNTYANWLAPGTKQEDTWRVGDNRAGL